MSRIEGRFGALARVRRKALVTYIMGGDPTADTTLETMCALVGAGADIIELGIPFSDPMADGPVIQRAGERALAGGMSLAGVLDIVRRFRREDADTPVVLMGYLNPIETMGHERFAAAAGTAGVDGVIVVDLPPEEAAELRARLVRHGLDFIFLVAPTTSPERLGRICALASGFIYYVSLTGVTGARTLDVAEVSRKLEPVRAASPIPVGVGFGIRDAGTAAAISRVSDAVVVGTALVAEFEGGDDAPTGVPARVAARVRAMREAMDAATESPVS